MKELTLPVALLLASGCSLTFYGLKETKEEPKPKTAAACVETLARGQALAQGPRGPDAPAKPSTPVRPVTPAPPIKPAPPAKPTAAEPGPDVHSPSMAAKP